MEDKQPETIPQQQQTPPVMENIAPQQPAQAPQIKGTFPKWIMYILIVVIGLAVAGIGVGAYYYLTKEDEEEAAPEASTTDTSDTTTNDQDTTDTDTDDTDTTDAYEGWNDYSNEGYNYQIKYPSDWEISEADDPNGKALWMSKGEDPQKGGFIRITTFDLFDECEDGGCTYEDITLEMNNEQKKGQKISLQSELIRIEFTFDITVNGEEKTLFVQLRDKALTNLYEEAKSILKTFDLLDSSEGTYTGWKTYNDQDGRLSFKYPSGWNLYESDYNPLGYEVSVTGKSSYSIVFSANEGNYGYYCIFSDTDTSNMPDDYKNGVKQTKEYSSYTEFNNKTDKYRMAPSSDNENSYNVCIYDSETSLYDTVNGTADIDFVISEETDETQVDILKKILFSATCPSCP